MEGEKAEIGKRIKEIRRNKGIMAIYVANKLGITPARYSQIEKDATNLTLKRAQDIANILGVSISSFFI